MTAHVPDVEPLPADLGTEPGIVNRAVTIEVGSPWRLRAVVDRAARGAMAGVAATIPMACVQLAGRGAHRPPPSFAEVTKRAGRKLPLVPTPRGMTLGIAATLAHFAFGGAAGAVYAVVAPAQRRFVTAPVYALGIAAVSYFGWVPALGLMPRPSRDDTNRQVVTFVAHAVYGAALAGGLELLDLDEPA